MEIDINEEAILKEIGIDVFREKRNYWFVRTQKGTYYDDFLNDSFIGIEWDKVSDINFIKNCKEDDLKVEVNKEYPVIERPGYVASQIYKFCNNMKSGDIVLIPSQESKWISIGEILNDDIYLYEKEQAEFSDILDDLYDENDEVGSLLIKRRRVKWIKTVKRTELDPYLYSIIYSHNAIVDANSYSVFIDRMLSQFYIKGDEAYFTYKINKKSNIPYYNMLSFLNNNDRLMNYICDKFPEIGFDKSDIIIKVNVQSRGPLQIKGKISNILILGIVITALFGANFDFEFLGAKVNIESEGLPKLITTIKEVFNKVSDEKDSDKELQEISKGFKEDKENLEIQVPTSDSE